MIVISVSWTVGAGQDCRGGNQKSPAWREIELKLNEIKKSSGTITVDLTGMADFESRSLQVQTENGSSILSLVEDDDIRTFTNKHMDRQQIEILGDLWDSRLVCQDFDIVVRVFKEFYDTGDVSRDILS
jgi:hypothetical protein